MIAKLSAADGSGRWAMRLGGTSSERMYDMAASTDGGLVLMGYTESTEIDLGDTKLAVSNNVREGVARGAAAMVRAAATLGLRRPSPPGSSPARAAPPALILDRYAICRWQVVKISGTEHVPSCLSSCTMSADGKRSTKTVVAGTCFIGNQCYANNAASPSAPCFKCDASTSITSFTGPDTSNHCYISIATPSWRGAGTPTQKCVAAGEAAPAYLYRNRASECEVCDPTKATTTWSLRSDGFEHDRTQAQQEKSSMGAGSGTQTSANGMEFSISSNGCQPLPTVAVPSSPMGIVATAVSAVVSAPVVSRMLSAISVMSLTSDPHIWEAASVYWGRSDPSNS
eukprot:4723451-Prymnesium_polylepis.1